MDLTVAEEPIRVVAELASIPIAFTVDRIFEVSDREGGLGGLVMSERKIDVPYVKDYDTMDGEGPAQWATRFDVSNWGLIGAHSNGVRVGGAVIAYNTDGIDMLEGRKDLAALWDIRVAPEARRQGVGAALFRAVEAWTMARGCRQLKVETQNVNVAACKFYARQGCLLGAINRFAYPKLPDEVQLIWCKDLPALIETSLKEVRDDSGV